MKNYWRMYVSELQLLGTINQKKLKVWAENLWVVYCILLYTSVTQQNFPNILLHIG